MLILCFIVANIFSFLTVKPNGLANLKDFSYWSLFYFIVIALVLNVVASHKIATGKVQEILFYFSSTILMSMSISYLVYCLARCELNFAKLDWFGFLCEIVQFNFNYCAIVFVFIILLTVFYATVINRRFIYLLGRTGVRGSGKLKQVKNSNLENSHWMTNDESRKVFKFYSFSELGKIKKDGVPVQAILSPKGKDMKVAFNSPCHSIVIGSTGSGKTTTFVSPMIQLLAASGAGSSMVITDPKGELFSLHSNFLSSRGYDVKVIDLRDTYSSYRWNPLDSIWDNYQLYLNPQDKASLHFKGDDFGGLQLVGNKKDFESASKWYEFDGKAFTSYDMLIDSIDIYRKKIFDEVYEDLNDLVTVLIPVENEKDPMWEKGARAICLATLLAMLEDSENPELEMTKEKYNFFNLAKILQNSSNDYEELRNYFRGRSSLSKAYSLSKQVCDAATQTRASYMSIVYEKLTLFNDAGICALTSSSDFSSAGLNDRPTALFLKIPDEKDTRHNLAAIFILNIYKTLIKVASAREELSLERNVYFIMDEFGNMPKIEKFDKFITVGRSRKIWFTMIIQSYAQLNNVYGENVAEIVKGNCGIKMFIGSNDMGTCKEYSELCGNITVATTSSNGSVYSNDVNLSVQTQVRPLIYPSELQRLNHAGDIGHSIIVTFGNFPLKTYFTPSFKVPLYKFGQMNTDDIERMFDENAVYYSAQKRNEIIFGNEKKEEQKPVELKLADSVSIENVGRTKVNLDEEPIEMTDLNGQQKLLTEEELEVLDAYRRYKKGKFGLEIKEFFDYMKKQENSAKNGKDRKENDEE